MNLGLLLKAYRTEQCLQQKDLAERLRTTAPTLSKIEQGQVPKGELYYRILCLFCPKLESTMEYHMANAAGTLQQLSSEGQRFLRSGNTIRHPKKGFIMIKGGQYAE
jgi:transcriptional regulator with XRE-family HTH domain